MHVPDRKPLMDVITCIREHCTIEQAGFRLAANAERHLKPPEEMARLFRRHPEAIMRTMEIAERCTFSLDELRYEYPDDEAPPEASESPIVDLSDPEGAVGFMLQQIWFAALVGWASGLHDEARIVEYIHAAAHLMLKGLEAA